MRACVRARVRACVRACGRTGVQACVRERRGSLMVSTTACHTGVSAVRVPDREHDIIRCKNLAIYIRDCISVSFG